MICEENFIGLYLHLITRLTLAVRGCSENKKESTNVIYLVRAKIFIKTIEL